VSVILFHHTRCGPEASVVAVADALGGAPLELQCSVCGHKLARTQGLTLVGDCAYTRVESVESLVENLLRWTEGPMRDEDRLVVKTVIARITGCGRPRPPPFPGSG